MKPRNILGLALVTVLSCAPEKPFENPGIYGVAPDQKGTTEISEIISQAGEYEGKEVLVEGVTGAVCENRGCWMYIADGEARIRVTFKDYGFFVPKDAAGKRVRAYGIVSSRLVSKEKLQHWAEETPGGDPSSVRGDSTVTMLTASGVVIENGGEVAEDQEELMSDCN